MTTFIKECLQGNGTIRMYLAEFTALIGTLATVCVLVLTLVALGVK